MKKIFIFIFVFILAICLVSVPTLAVTEDEVQEQIDKVGKDAVTGNILVWFLCAIGFLKVSQKIDSFMSAIGINVGNTGGSMLTEGLLAIRGAGIAKSFLGGKGFGGGGGKGGGSKSGSGSPFKGGLIGMTGRGITNNAIQNANGNKSHGIGGLAYSNSLKKGGGFANRVIGSIANGSTKSEGMITGDGAADALTSYAGSTFDKDFHGKTPQFSDVEIGGGKMTGVALDEASGEEKQFAMYSAEQYNKPEGDYSTVKAADGSSWYRQYATDTIVSHPFVEPDGYVNRGETVEQKLPRAPSRRN